MGIATCPGPLHHQSWSRKHSEYSFSPQSSFWISEMRWLRMPPGLLPHPLVLSVPCAFTSAAGNSPPPLQHPLSTMLVPRGEGVSTRETFRSPTKASLAGGSLHVCMSGGSLAAAQRPHVPNALLVLPLQRPGLAGLRAVGWDARCPPDPPQGPTPALLPSPVFRAACPALLSTLSSSVTRFWRDSTLLFMLSASSQFCRNGRISLSSSFNFSAWLSITRFQIKGIRKAKCS